jgi:hypothetical protein
MSLTFTPLVSLPLSLSGPARTQNPQYILFAFCVSDYDDTSPDRPNGDETILLVGMLLVEDLKVVNSAPEKLAGVVKRQSVFFPIALVLRRIPLRSHGTKRIYAIDLVSQRLIQV